MADDLLEDDELLDDDEMEEEIDDEMDEEELDEAPSSRRSAGRRSGGRSRRASGRSRRERKPKQKRDRNYVLSLVLCIFLGPIGLDRFIYGEYLMGAFKLLGTGAAAAILFANDSIGLVEPMNHAVILVALLGVLLPIQLHDFILYGMKAMGWGKTYATVFCADFNKSFELDLEDETVKDVVCVEDGHSASAPMPPQDVTGKLREHCHAMLDHSLFGVTLFVGAAACIAAAFWLTAPGSSGVFDFTDESDTAFQILIGGGILLVLLTLWQTVVAEKQSPMLRL